MTPTCVTLFSGFGLKAVGAKAAGFELVGAAEYDESIAAVYAANLGERITVRKVEEIDPRLYAGIDLLMASPVCTRMSIANANRGETEVDTIAAEGVCRWLRVTRPKIFVLENVTQYRASRSCKMIESCLSELGYHYKAENVNSANFGVPQTRRRLIIRALRDSMVPALPLPVAWNGWYSAVEDILHTLPKSKFAPWQIMRLPEEMFSTFLSDSCVNTAEGRAGTCGTSPEPAFTIKASAMRREITTPKALLIEGDAAGDRPPTCGKSAEPAFAIKTSSGGRVHRAFLPEGQMSFLCGIQGESGNLARAGGTPAPTITAVHNAGKYRAFLVDGQNMRDSQVVTVPHSHEPSFTTMSAQKGLPRAFLAHGTADNDRFPLRESGDPAFTITNTNGTHKALLVSDQRSHNGDRCGVPDAAQPAMTADTRPASKTRAWLEEGRVVAMTSRALARFQTLPDWFRLPADNTFALSPALDGSKTLAAKGIGNGAPCLMMEIICRQLLEAIS